MFLVREGNRVLSNVAGSCILVVEGGGKCHEVVALPRFWSGPTRWGSLPVLWE